MSILNYLLTTVILDSISKRQNVVEVMLCHVICPQSAARTRNAHVAFGLNLKTLSKKLVL